MEPMLGMERQSLSHTNSQSALEIFETSSSEFKAYAELNSARRVSLSGGFDEAKLAITRGVFRVRWRKPRCIKGIENFSAQLQSHSLTWREFFVEIGVEVVNAICPQS